MSSDARLEQLQQDLARLRDPTEPAKSSDDGRGREADHPGEIPLPGWKDILWRAWGEVSEQNMFLITGGVTYAVLLALFPGLAALVSLYGLLSTLARLNDRWRRSRGFCQRRHRNFYASNCTVWCRRRMASSASPPS